MKPMTVRLLILAAVALGSAAPAHATFLSNYTAHEASGNRVVFHCGVPSVVVELWSEQVVRLSLYPDGVIADDSSLAVLPRAAVPVAHTIDVGAGAITIRTTAITIECRKTPFRLRIADAAGTTLLDEPAAGGMSWSGNARAFQFGIGADRLYGLGERALSFDLRGQRFGTYNQAIYGYGANTPTMNINIPFLTSSRGWGLFLDNAWPGTFDLAQTVPNVISGSAESGPLRLFFMAGPGLAAVVERFTWLTGRQPMPPRWALGYLQSKFGYRSRSEVEALASGFRTRGIPLDGVYLDLYWYGQPSDMGRMTWDAAHWPNPAQMIANLKATGVHTLLIEEPYLITSTANHAYAAANGLLGTTGGGAPYAFGMWAGTAGLIDFTKRSAADWWWGLHRPLMADGVAGWWLDLGEPETHPDDMVHASGSARSVHDAYNLRWLQAHYDRQRAEFPGDRVFLLTRSGFAGMQRTGAVSWSGDVQKTFSALAVQIPMLLGMGLSGVAWHNSDIGGYTFGPTTPELYVRWMQFGAFCPITRAHGSGQDTEPWVFGAQAEAICRNYLRLRQRLMPYAYTMARENTQTGMPLARPLVLEYPNDPNVPGLGDEYLWGRSMLVAPVTSAGAVSRSVYVPPGRWTNYWTNELLVGGTTVTLAAPLDRMPLLVRAGSIVPMQNPMPASSAFALDTLTLDIFPADTASFELYEDDGVSYAHETGAFATTALTLAIDSRSTRVHIGASQGSYAGKPASRTWITQIRHVLGPPSAVTADGASVAMRADSSALAVGANGWWYDSAGSRVLVKLRRDAVLAANIELLGLSVAGVNDLAPVPVTEWSLRAYPNPATSGTTLSVTIPPDYRGRVRLVVFDLHGREVADLSNALRFSGNTASVSLGGRGLPDGAYYARLSGGGYRGSLKITLVR